MSNKNKTQKTVRIEESKLIDVIEGIVAEAVASKKREWIAEQRKKQDQLISERVDAILKNRLKGLLK